MTLELADHYVVQPAFPWWDRDRKFGLSGGRPVPEGFRYASDTNSWWLTHDELRQLISGTVDHEPRVAVGAPDARPAAHLRLVSVP